MIPFGPGISDLRTFTIEEPDARSLAAQLNRLVTLLALLLTNEEEEKIFIDTFDVAGSGHGGNWLATVVVSNKHLEDEHVAAIKIGPGAPGAFFFAVEQAGKTDIALPDLAVLFPVPATDTTTGHRLDQQIALTPPAPQGFEAVLYDVHSAGMNAGQRYIELALVAYRSV